MEAIGYKITDVSSNREYFSKDIDLLATRGTQSMSIEVKSDSRLNETGNVCIETVTNRQHNKKGWFYYTEATHIFFVDVNENVIHCVRLDELKKLYHKKDGSFRTVITK